MPKKSYKERQYNLTNDEMYKLVMEFQAGNESAGIKMMEVFENFLANFIKLLFYGVYDRNNYELRRFIGFYVPEGYLRFKLLKNQMNSSEMKQINDVIRGISGMVQRNCEIEDVQQAINLSFLQCLRVYKPRESSQGGSVPIPNYISNYSLYLFKKATDTYLINQLGRHTFPLMDEKDSNEKTDYAEPVQQGMAPPVGPGLEEFLDREEFDERWVSGESAKGIFALLTPSERQILKWRYIDGEKASEIANRILEHSNTSRERLAAIKQKLKDAMAEQQNEMDRIDKIV
jgi:DNA-directed RNA polymerase specialized sigma24 family protein